MIGDVRLHVTTWGDRSNPPVVLLHGWATCGLAWRHVAPALAQHFFVVAPDNRGNGRSDRSPAGGFALERYAEDTLLLCRALDLQRPAVIGHSWGANIAQILASAGHTDAFSRFVMLDPVNWAMTHAFATIVPGIIAQRKSREEMGLLAWEQHCGPPAIDSDAEAEWWAFHSYSPETLRIIARSNRSWALECERCLAQIDHPTLLLLADPAAGSYVRAEEQACIRDLVAPAAGLVEVREWQDVGHGMHMTAPHDRRLVQEATEFLTVS